MRESRDGRGERQRTLIGPFSPGSASHWMRESRDGRGGKAKDAHWSILLRVRPSLDARKIGTAGGRQRALIGPFFPGSVPHWMREK